MSVPLKPRLFIVDPLASQSPIELARLAHHSVVDVPEEVPRIWWDNWVVNPRPGGIPVRFGPVAEDVEAMLHAVARGQAIAFAPAAIRHLYPRPGVIYADVVDLPSSTAVLAWLPASRDLPVLTALRHVAFDVVRRDG
ncbi:LysR substrate-binding domain-containing protein [Streptomyces sp. NPDC001868]|uniref:LysR substrate-binding domain-containing protein n=1 Tax=Streptomyces sp. NPDC001868 TaxID=3154401 RepID=UPI003317DDC6